MFVHGTGILPLIRLLKAEFPKMEQPWCANDAGAGGNFDCIRGFFHKLEEEIGPNFGCFPEPLKNILVVGGQHNLEAAQQAFPDFGFEVTSTGNCCLGDFVSKDSALNDWIREKTMLWEEVVADLASAAPNFPQAACSGVQKSLQQEWQFVQ
jgi:hypothetical protein